MMHTAAPPTPEASSLIYETTVKVAAQDPPGVFAESESNVKPLDAHHKMLHEGSILSSHLHAYRDAIQKVTGMARPWVQLLCWTVCKADFALHSPLMKSGRMMARTMFHAWAKRRTPALVQQVFCQNGHELAYCAPHERIARCSPYREAGKHTL